MFARRWIAIWSFLSLVLLGAPSRAQTGTLKEDPLTGTPLANSPGGPSDGSSRMFDRMANGKPTLVIADVTNEDLRGKLLEWAQSKNITNGQLTREQYALYMDEKRQARGFGGPRGGAQQALRAAEVAAAEANLKLAVTMLARDKAAGVRGPDLAVAQARVDLAKAELEVRRAQHKAAAAARPRQAPSTSDEALRRRVQELEKAVAKLTEENAQLRQTRAKPGAPPAARSEWAMFNLKHLAAGDSVKIIRALLGEGKVRLVAFDRTNSVLINGTPLDVKSIEALLVRLDVPGEDVAPRIEWKMYPLKHMQATDCAKIVQELMGKGKVHVVPIARTNSVLGQGQPADLKTIEALLMRLDVPADKHGPGKPRK